MHTKEPFVYTNVTPEEFASLEKLAQSHDLSVVGTNGRTQKDGYDLSWAYDGEEKTLTITVIQSPFFIPEQVIGEHFAKWVKQVQTPSNTVTE